jgi:hypothetical protein
MGGIQRHAGSMDTEMPRPRRRQPREIGEQRVRRWEERAESNEGRESARTPAARCAVVDETAGALTGVYESDHLASLREDWPA